MITRQQVDQLMAFRNGEHLITSCYLKLDRAQTPLQSLKIRIKDLLQSAQQELAAKAANHAQRESLRRDFAAIEQHVFDELAASRHRAVALFSCSAHKFWQTFGLPRLVRNILIADREPYVRPLTAILGGYHRYCTVLVDRVHGQIFEVYMDEILERSEVIDAVPRKVSEGGFGGTRERRLERRRDQAVHHHFQHLADVVFDLFQRDHFDKLVLGGHREELGEFKRHLHPWLQERWSEDFVADAARMPAAKVLATTVAIERRAERAREGQLATELVQRVAAKNLAVVGLGATLKALVRGEAQTLLVEEDFEMPGYVCRSCHQAGLHAVECPLCHKPMESCADLVEEAVATAIHKHCQVTHLHGVTPLREAGRIGAFLRYRS
ncbi:hypothetical protein HQ590_14630 [bacterium]|nr:hypothetical protein [bacterium]